MKTAISVRRMRFYRLINAAYDQPTDWLIANVRDYNANGDVSRLSLIACLRIIIMRTDKTGRVYRERMADAKRKYLGAQSCPK